MNHWKTLDTMMRKMRQLGDTIWHFPGYRWEPTPKNWEELTDEECLKILGFKNDEDETMQE